MLDEQATRLYPTPSATTGSSLWRLPEIFFQPTAAFRSIDRNPAWLAPVMAATVFRMVRMFAFFQPSREPLKLLVTAAIEAITFVVPIILCSALFIVVLYLAGGETTFRKIFSVLAHTFFLYTVVNVVLAVTIRALSADPASVDFQNPALTNLSFLVGAKQHLSLNYLLSALDLVVFYHLYLIGLGLSIVTRKCSLGKAIAVTLALWSAYVAAGMSIKSIVG